MMADQMLLSSIALGSSLVLSSTHVSPQERSNRILSGDDIESTSAFGLVDHEFGEADCGDARELGLQRLGTDAMYEIAAPVSSLDTPTMKAASVAVIMIFNVIFAIYFKNIANLIALIGGTFDSLFVIAFPAMVYQRIYAQKHGTIVATTILVLMYSSTLISMVASIRILLETFILGDVAA